MVDKTDLELSVFIRRTGWIYGLVAKKEWTSSRGMFLTLNV